MTKNLYRNKSVLITGGTGSFGKAFVKYLLSEKAQPKRIIIFSRDEQKHYQLQLKYPKTQFPNIRFFIGDVRDLDRLKMAMVDVDYVIHAAAMKHLSTAEYNPFECIKTNVIGAQNIILASLENNVRNVLALSSDKACNPANLYGASKLAADKIFINANNLVGKKLTKFSVVRYGNVLGSAGSVLPLFKKLIKENNKFLPITHKDMTRFWITLSQAVKFVNSSMLQSRGGEIFVPKMPSLHIVDLAKFIAPKMKCKFIGIKPGEKLFEQLNNVIDSRSMLEMEDRFIIFPEKNLQFYSYKKKFNASEVEINFEYTSDNNKDWLNEKKFYDLLNEA